MILHLVNLATADETTLSNCLTALGSNHSVVFLNGEQSGADTLEKVAPWFVAKQREYQCDYFCLEGDVPKSLGEGKTMTMQEFVALTETYSLTQTWY